MTSSQQRIRATTVLAVRREGRIAMAALLVIFALTGLMVWIAG